MDFFIIFAIIFKRLTSISDTATKSTAFIVLISAGLCGLGGSQLFNEINYSLVFWIIIGIFYNWESRSQLFALKAGNRHVIGFASNYENAQ